MVEWVAVILGLVSVGGLAGTAGGLGGSDGSGRWGLVLQEPSESKE